MAGEAAGVGPDLFRSIVAEADEGVVVLGPDRILLYANQAAEFLLGHGRDDLVGEMFGLPLSPAEATRVNVQAGDGHMRVVELAVEPLPAAADGALLVRLKDVTGYHLDVVTAREEVRRRDDFLAMLSHELRNPLAAIQGAGLLLARDDLAPAMRRESAEVFHRQLHHLGRILNDLLDITRVSRGTLEMKKEPALLDRIVRDAAAAAGPLVARKRHSLHVEAAASVRVWGDPTRLEQVITNLLNNAAKYTPPGGGLSVSVEAEGGEAVVRVRDDGPGIPPDLLPHVFEPFVQGKQTLDRSEGGLGIGLALARTIVRLHGGAIEAAPNAAAPGMTFTVRLPLACEPAPAEGPAPAGPRRLRVLLVEDSEDARRMLKGLLELDGHDVAEAADGHSGLAAFLAATPDVALIDIGLPGMNGFELARRLRSAPAGAAACLIALTGYGMPRDVEAASAAGFDHHLIKPLRYQDLCRILGTCSPAGCG